MADVGLVGFPNAGKSTLISQISNAKPKIANYQFTTLSPILGEVNYKNERIVFEDVPGLIEGASEGKGLGHEFLKHIERCFILIHLISLSEEDNDDLLKAYKTINNELKTYNLDLSKRPMLIVANKTDTPDANERLIQLQKKIKKKIIPISAKNKENLNVLLDSVYKIYIKIKKQNEIENIKKQKELDKLKEIKVRRKDERDEIERDCVVKKLYEGTYEVTSNYLTYWFNRIPLDTSDNNFRFNQKIANVKAEDKAKELGAKKGDTLVICGTEFTID